MQHRQTNRRVTGALLPIQLVANNCLKCEELSVSSFFSSNACPTRQEVVAPYWAVNTRGKMLAIVNDPPYEQHIHWENCL